MANRPSRTVRTSFVLVYYPQQLPEFFEAENDILPVPEFAKSFRLKLKELFSWLQQ